MDQVFGKSPSVQNEPYSTISPAQSTLQQLLANQASAYLPNMFSNISAGQAGVPYSGQFAAPLTGTQNDLISQIVGAAGPGGAANAPLTDASGTLTKLLSGQPQDYSQYFKTDVAAPLENTFQTQTLPAIKAAFARSAGGTNSVGGNTGYSAAVGQAGTQLGQQLEQAMQGISTQAVTNANNNMVSGVGLAPGLSSQFLQNYGAALGAASLPQQTAQTQLSGQYGQYSNSLNFLSSLFGQGTGLANSPTSNMNTVVNPGNPGYISYLMAGLGGALGKMA